MNKHHKRADAQANRDAVQEGRVYLAYTRTINPDTGKNWTIKEIAREVGEHYGYVRDRLALVSQVEVKSTRPRMLTVEEMEWLFDVTDEDNREGRMAIAECMGISLDLAIEESEARRSKSFREQDAKGET